jgi:hypothetical protein
MRLINKFTDYLSRYNPIKTRIKRISGEKNFISSKDIDQPGNWTYICFDEDEKYEIEGNTHGLLSHAIKHYSKFNKEKVNDILDRTKEYLNELEGLIILKTVKNKTLCYNKDAKKLMNLRTILNTFDLINDKIMNGYELYPQEKEIYDKFMTELIDAYSSLINEYLKKAVDVRNKKSQELIELMQKGEKLRFRAIYKGIVKEYIADFSDFGLLSIEDKNKIATLFKKTKDDYDFDLFIKYLNFKLIIKDKEFSQAVESFAYKGL